MKFSFCSVESILSISEHFPTSFLSSWDSFCLSCSNCCRCVTATRAKRDKVKRKKRKKAPINRGIAAEFENAKLLETFQPIFPLRNENSIQISTRPGKWVNKWFNYINFPCVIIFLSGGLNIPISSLLNFNLWRNLINKFGKFVAARNFFSILERARDMKKCWIMKIHRHVSHKVACQHNEFNVSQFLLLLLLPIYLWNEVKKSISPVANFHCHREWSFPSLNKYTYVLLSICVS